MRALVFTDYHREQLGIPTRAVEGWEDTAEVVESFLASRG